MTKDQISYLDDLFRSARQFSKSKEFMDMLDFCRKMRHLGPYNAMLAHIQRPGAVWLCSASEWQSKFHRHIKDTARPLVILMPFGPVEYLYDLEDTISDIPFDTGLLKLYAVSEIIDESMLDHLIESMAYCGIALERARFGSAQTAEITSTDHIKNDILIVYRKSMIHFDSDYKINVNDTLSPTAAFAAICHELGHFFCHHLPAPDGKLWMHRRLPDNVAEFEAEATSKIVCDHFNIESKAEQYLARYVDNNEFIPDMVSTDLIFQSAGKIINMATNPFDFKRSMAYKLHPEVVAQAKHIDALVNGKKR